MTVAFSSACPYCDRRYARASSCHYLDRDPMPLPFDAPDGFRCAECNVTPGNPHHPYCDRAECGQCGGAFAECGGVECGGSAA